MDAPKQYDGFTIVPDDIPGNSRIIYFNLDDDSKEGLPIENSELGDKYHVVLFKAKDDGADFDFDETFEAVFVDPMFYAKRLLPYFYCMFVRKTDKSEPWFEDYLRELFERILIKNLKKHKKALESIANN